MIKSDYFWFKECPICDGQGRLIIKKNINFNKLFFFCDECMSCWEMKMSGWVTPTSLSKEINKLCGK